MTLSLHTLSQRKGTKNPKKRLGRGYGSGKGGHTASRGQKGQKSRSGSSGHLRRGMRRLVLATPKLRGFKSPIAKAQVVSLAQIDALYIAKEVVSPNTLIKKGLIADAKMPVKILASGEISKAVTVKKCAVSKTATQKIEAVGGKVEK